MDVDEALIRIQRQLVHAGPVRLRLPDAAPDESWFFLVAILAGAICGYIAALP